ncbi:MAG: GIY-YIG nuclease family protein [Dehalococcoidia bacterium]
MYYVYILQSKKDMNLYVGYTADLQKRTEQHNKGVVESTKNRRPLDLIYYEACISQADALHREKYLKTAYGKRYIKNRLKDYFRADD